MGTYERKQKKSEGSNMDNYLSEIELNQNQIIKEIREIHNVWMLDQIRLFIQNIKR